MAHGVFIHRKDSIYDDKPSERYQFPRQYLSRVQACIGDWIVYYEPSKVPQTRGYYAVAQVQDVVPDPRKSGMFIAVIRPGSYLDFGDSVPFRGPDGLTEQGVLNEAGRISGRAQSAVRPLSPQDFARIVDRGLGLEDPSAAAIPSEEGFSETQAPFEVKRDRSASLASRLVRDRNFRKIVLRAYDQRCAFTGLRLINGGGRAEVQAAHIRPVEESGPDLLSNGIALSGTAHWMFDRGLIGVEDDMRLMISRQVNDRDAVTALMNPTGSLIPPDRSTDRPHPAFLSWHRTHVFKH